MPKVSNYSRRRSSAQTDGSADYAAKRSELLKIAAKLFKAQGFQSTKLADIAREAGLDRATVYYYVGMLNWTHRWFVPGGAMSGQQIAESFWSIFIGGARAGSETANIRRSERADA